MPKRSPPQLPPREQLYIPGTEPARDPAIEDALYRWLDACDAARGASEDKRTCALALTERLVLSGLRAYPYLDRATGRRRLVRAVDEIKVKASNAPAADKDSADALDRERDMAGDASAAERAARDAREQAELREQQAMTAAKPGKPGRPPRAVRGKPTPVPRPVPRLVPDPVNAGEIVDDDPFGVTRDAMADEPSDADAELTPAQRASAESARAREARRNGKAPGTPGGAA